MADADCIRPDWPAPDRVQAFTTSRKNGFSSDSYASLNLAQHVADDAVLVERNRKRLIENFNLPSSPLWLQQTHSKTVLRADDYLHNAISPEADAAWASRPNMVCAVLTADCLPVLFTNIQGDRIAAAHAGWRGALNGIISESFLATGIAAEDCLVWLGPAIGAENFEVGSDVYDAFIKKNPENITAFKQTDEQHWLCDIYRLARIELQKLGIHAIYGGGLCTYSDAERFYSFRRDGVETGRMASLIWIKQD